jgi:hypothetical protein
MDEDAAAEKVLNTNFADAMLNEAQRQFDSGSVA